MVNSMVLVTATGDHDRPDWMTTFTGIRNYNLNGSSLPRKIIEHTPIDAVDASRCDAAGRTLSGSRTGYRLDGDFVGSRQHPGYVERMTDEGQQT
jgi:hypothetical protein